MSRAVLRELVAVAATLADLASRLAADADDDPGELLPLATAATLAGCSVRTLRDAIRSRELAAYGRQRSRTIRRSDLSAWIEGRRVRPIAGVDDLDMQRRIARLGRSRRCA